MTGLFTYKSIFNLLPPATIKLFTPVDEVHEHFTRGSHGLTTQYALTNYYIRGSPCHVGAQLFGITFLPAGLPCFTQFKKAWRRYLTFIKPTEGN